MSLEVILCADKGASVGIVSGAIHVEDLTLRAMSLWWGLPLETPLEAYAALEMCRAQASVVATEKSRYSAGRYCQERATSAVAWTLSSEILWLQLLKRDAEPSYSKILLQVFAAN